MEHPNTVGHTGINASGDINFYSVSRKTCQTSWIAEGRIPAIYSEECQTWKGGKNRPPSSRGLGHLPFTEATGIRIPLGVLAALGQTELWKC